MAEAAPVGVVPVDVVIRARALDVRESGTYVGFFEWLIWSVIEDVSVRMPIGANLLDVAALFGHLDGVRPVHYPIACQISEEGLYPARYETHSAS